MTRDHRRDVLTLLAIAFAGALLIAALFARGTHVVRDPLSAIPSDAFVVGTLDVRALATSPLGASIAGEKGAHAGALFGVDSIEAVCGFDPLPHILAVAVAIPEGDTHGELGVSLSGDLSKSALMSCAKALIEKRGGRWSTRESGSYSTVSEDRDHGAEIAFREGGPFLVGRGEWLEKMIDAAEGRSKSMALPGDDPQHRVRGSLATDDAEAKAIVLSAVLPASIRDRIGAEMAREVGAGESGENPTMRGVLDVSAVGIAVHAGTNREDTRILGELRCDGDAQGADVACKKVETLLLHERLKLSGDHRIRFLGLGPLIDGLKTQVSGGSLTFHTSIPSEALARMITHLFDSPPRPPSATTPSPKPDDLVRAPLAPPGSPVPHTTRQVHVGDAG